MKTLTAIATSKPVDPVFAFRPATLARAVDCFRNRFCARTLYAVKTNPDHHILQAMHAQGIDGFEIASLQEIRTVKAWAPTAQLFFMHPVKSPQAIREAYDRYGVRHFALDTHDELTKILHCTHHATDLSLHVRLAIPNTFAELNLAEKFGVNLQDAPALLTTVRQVARELGITFHVGSQCMHPDAYRMAMRMAANVMAQAKVVVEYFNVGGGFPSVYPGMIPPPLHDYFTAITDEFSHLAHFAHLDKQPQLLCEPGRALVAESTSVIVNVQLRKGNTLYINDGTYGSLFDAGIPQFIFPVRLLRAGSPAEPTDKSNLTPFSFYGPTCDSLDYMKGPFYLPNDVSGGDYIEIGQIGAYGRTLATQFNGFCHRDGVEVVSDSPLMTMYEDDSILQQPLETMAA